MALAMVKARYTRSDEKHPRCPLSFQVLRHGSKSSTFHFIHIIPKTFGETICVHLSDNPDNIFPSTELVHKNMELYQSIPNMTVKFERRFNDHFDEYGIVFSPELPLFHELRASIGAVDGQPRRVLFVTGSRPFLDLHHRVFQEHHKSAVPAMSRFDELVSQQLFSQIVLHSPTMKDNRNRVKIERILHQVLRSPSEMTAATSHKPGCPLKLPRGWWTPFFMCPQNSSKTGMW